MCCGEVWSGVGCDLVWNGNGVVWCGVVGDGLRRFHLVAERAADLIDQLPAVAESAAIHDAPPIAHPCSEE